MDEATLPRDSLVAAAAVKIVAPHAPGAWRCKRRLVAFLSSILFCLSTESFCGENLAGEAEAFSAPRSGIFLFCTMDMRVLREGRISK